MNRKETDCIRIFSDASIRNGKTGLGYCFKSRTDTGSVVRLETGWEVIDREMVGGVQAEYRALVHAVEEAEKYDMDHAVLFSDCHSIIKTINGEDESFDPYWKHENRFESAIHGYDDWNAFLVMRDENTTAHRKARLASGPTSEYEEAIV